MIIPASRILTGLPPLPVQSIVFSSIALSSKFSILDPSYTSFLISSIYAIATKNTVALNVQNFAWNVLLQTALTLSLFQLDNNQNHKNGEKNENAGKSNTMCIYFFFATVGSIFGGLIASNLFDKKLSKTAIGSLVASYIGGTANFFEVAGNEASNPIIISIAAVDVSVMIFYFGFFHGC